LGCICLSVRVCLSATVSPSSRTLWARACRDTCAWPHVFATLRQGSDTPEHERWEMLPKRCLFVCLPAPLPAPVPLLAPPLHSNTCVCVCVCVCVCARACVYHTWHIGIAKTEPPVHHALPASLPSPSFSLLPFESPSPLCPPRPWPGHTKHGTHIAPDSAIKGMKPKQGHVAPPHPAAHASRPAVPSPRPLTHARGGPGSHGE